MLPSSQKNWTANNTLPIVNTKKKSHTLAKNSWRRGRNTTIISLSTLKQWENCRLRVLNSCSKVSANSKRRLLRCSKKNKSRWLVIFKLLEHNAKASGKDTMSLPLTLIKEFWIWQIVRKVCRSNWIWLSKPNVKNKLSYNVTLVAKNQNIKQVCVPWRKGWQKWAPNSTKAWSNSILNNKAGLRRRQCLNNKKNSKNCKSNNSKRKNAA